MIGICPGGRDSVLRSAVAISSRPGDSGSAFCNDAGHALRRFRNPLRLASFRWLAPWPDFWRASLWSRLAVCASVPSLLFHSSEPRGIPPNDSVALPQSSSWRRREEDALVTSCVITAGSSSIAN
jgi:hypothetical protein